MLSVSYTRVLLLPTRAGDPAEELPGPGQQPRSGPAVPAGPLTALSAAGRASRLGWGTTAALTPTAEA